jgi:hypothetical protein
MPDPSSAGADVDAGDVLGSEVTDDGGEGVGVVIRLGPRRGEQAVRVMAVIINTDEFSEKILDDLMD